MTDTATKPPLSAAPPRLPLAETVASQAVAYATEHATAHLCGRFGPAAMRVTTCGSVLSSLVVDPLRHASTNCTSRVNLHLVMIDGKETGVGASTVRELGLAQTARDMNDNTNNDAPTLIVDEEWNLFSLADPKKHRIVVWFADASVVPVWIIYDHIRNALHWLSSGCNFGMFHAAAVRYGSIGCLITGKSGSGKSTITAAAVANGFTSAGDDFVLIETAPIPRAHAVFDTLKLDQKGLSAFPMYEPFIRNPRRNSEDKALVHLYDCARDRIATGFRLHAILHARVTGEQESRIRPSAPGRAFLALAPSSLFLLRAQSKQVSKKCASLVGQLSSHSFEIGTNLGVAVAELSAFMREQARP